jgi:hypothetical protein
MTLLSKAKKMYLLKLMSGLDRVSKLGNGCFLADEGLRTLNLYEYGTPGGARGEELLAFVGEEDKDRFNLLDPEYLKRGDDKFIPGRVIYSPTAAARDLYYELVEDEIVEAVEDYWRVHRDDEPGLVSVRANNIGKWSISVSPGTFVSCVEYLKREHRVLDFPKPTEMGSARLYMPEKTASESGVGQPQGTVSDQYNSGRDQIVGDHNVINNYLNGPGSGSDLSNEEQK